MGISLLKEDSNSRTVLIGINNRFSHRTNKWLYGLSGLILFINVGFNIERDFPDPLGLSLGIVMTPLAIYYTFYVLHGFSPKSQFAPKVKVDPITIELKPDLWHKATRLPWADIASIEFKPYQINFQLTDTIHAFTYHTTADISLEIKELIRAVAESKQIQVVRG